MKETIAPVPTCDFSWTGFYIGGRVGYGWGNDTNLHAEGLPNTSFHIDPGHQDLDPDGFIGGGEIGFNWQVGHFVIGAEADFSGADVSGDTTKLHFVPEDGVDVPLRASQNINWFGTVRGRIGFVPWCRVLIYGTGGFAYANVDDSADLDFIAGGVGSVRYPGSRNDTQTGWTAGGGLEFAISRHWTIKAEYLYVDVGDGTAIGNPAPPNPPFQVRYNWDTQFHTVGAGLNFKF